MTPTIKSLVQGFAQHIRELKAPEYKESQVRLHYIDPFWKLLGWDVDNAAQCAPQDVEVQVEPSMDTVGDDGFRSREPDYLFRANGFPRFVVEAKKPAVDIETDKRAIFQAKRYAWNASIPFAVLTDFEQFRLYDATLKPVLNDPNRGLVSEFVIDFQDYPGKWAALEATFGRDAVAAGSLESLLARLKKLKAGRRVRSVDRMLIDLRGAEPVDRVFLDHLEIFRQKFARAIYHDNKRDFPEANTLHGAARLTETVQRLIDRIVFMRVCEDRGIAPYGTLRATLDRVSAEGGDFYKTLCADFRDLDREYNGYLFKYHFSEDLEVDANVLADFVRTLYPPDGPWDFARIGDDILGIVYERFLGHTVTVKRGEAIVEEKPEVRHAGGVYYTPRFVVDTIIRRVVGPKIAGKSPAQVLDVKILDPACGSGSFLVAAFQYLMDHCLAAVAADPALATVPATPKARKKRKDIAFKDTKGRWHLAPDFRAALLTNCIHGVDIDQQAVEVTVMSLYLKMVESALPPNRQRWIENELLPPLDSNIACGNSLISTADYHTYATHTKSALFGEDKDTAFRINRFDWRSETRGFGLLAKARGVKPPGEGMFDCIIGNPPYICVQELNEWAPEECQFYKWRYKSAKKGNFDIYVVFVERCLDLLAPDGLLGFIMQHRFWQARYGEGLRKVVADGKHLRAVVDFGDQQVFRGATTYTAIHILGRQPATNGVDYANVYDLQDGRAQCATLDAGQATVGAERFKARQPQGAGPWVFSDAADSAWLDAVRANHPTLDKVSERIAQGIVTSDDDVFFLHRVGKRYKSDATEKTYDLEGDVVHPLLKGAVHMKRWVPLIPDRAVLFPYEAHDGEWRLIPEKRFATEYPAAWAYLNENKKRLESRESDKMKGKPGWYGYVYPKNLDVMTQPKILVPAIAQSAEYCLDARGEYHYVGSGGGGGGGHGVVANGIDLHYLCGLLNSACLDAFLQRVTTPFHSGWFAYSKAYIAQIPIKVPETADEKKKAARIAESVRAIMAAKTRLRDARLSDRERRVLEGEVESLEARIDETVFALYGVKGVPGD
jgi:type I restriction-modification system DNA methylase subunit